MPTNRRTFLAGSLATAAALGVAACSSSGDSDGKKSNSGGGSEIDKNISAEITVWDFFGEDRAKSDDALFNEVYADSGRASVAPEKLLRAMLIQVLFSVRSERQLMEQIRYNLLYRWFIGLAIDDAVRNGLDEAIRLNERGEITSACMANIFWIKNGRCFTPSLRTGCLSGTVREFVMENIDCEEIASYAEALTDTDGIFLTSSGIGVAAAWEFNGVKLPRPRHPILELLPFRAQQNTNPHE